MPYADPKKAKLYRKKYYENNKAQILEKSQAYYQRTKAKHAKHSEAWRIINREWYNNYYKTWRKNNVESVKRSLLNWTNKNKHKKRAQMDVYNALRRKELFKENCAVCGSKKVHAHHNDYSKPLEVLWLCPLHHSNEHKKG